MANIKSQIKRIKQNEKRHQRNKAVKSDLKTAVRKFREAAESGEKDQAAELARSAGRKLDKAVSQGRHPQEPGRQPQVGHRQEGRVSLTDASHRPAPDPGGFVASGAGWPQSEGDGSRRPVMVSTRRSRV